MKTDIWVRKDDPMIEVDAIRLNEGNVEAAADWSGAMLVEEIDHEHPAEKQFGLNVWTPDGTRRASLGMYLVRYGSNFLVAHSRVFEDMYKPRDKETKPPESIADSRRRRGFADPFNPGRP